ncbi:A/G-specific adenine glycosylase [Schlesneria paludicola]|uniref:A/G-specific adenine glycosylase n=1 Tax=Schlesneria paludicola TaxID=360056 RepID=UPI00029A2339|nr:A/G-specific adenine glycosylase [Schlesneria paludicola]
MDSADYALFRRQLMAWYSVRARDLPWRRTADAYRIWISEIMLQQTTVAAVIPYFERFLTRFPSVEDLAAAEEADVLRLWEGLGYYSRARNLRRAAQVIVEQYAGRFPADVAELQSLPGIGRYTAGAIASFAFDLRAPIVEANTLRLYCRLLGYEGDPRAREGSELLWQFAEAILPRKNPGLLNQALMELGATVCIPRNPQCDTCPVQRYCAAFRENRQESIPRPKTRTKITDITEVSIAIQQGPQFLLRRRTEKERWAGLWDFVRFEIDPGDPSNLIDFMVETVRTKTGLSIELGPQIVELKHGVTRYRITLRCFVAHRVKGRLLAREEWKWVAPESFHEFPLSVTAREFAVRLTP